MFENTVVEGLFVKCCWVWFPSAFEQSLSYQVVRVVVSIQTPAGSCAKFGWKVVGWKMRWGFDGAGGCGWKVSGWGVCVGLKILFEKKVVGWKP